MQMGKWQDATSQQVKLITKRLNELLTTGVDLLHSELGVDLGIKPELPSWVILLAACIGLVLMVALWASACRGFFKKQPAIVATAYDNSESKTSVIKPLAKTEDQKKKKKKADKKAQANGRADAETPEEEVIVKEETVPHQPIPSEVKTEKASEIKKSKKRPKQVAKEAKTVTTAVKEPEEGTWETKVSNKEKREQRRKDKAPSDGSASPGGGHTPSVTPTEQPKVPAAPAPVSAGQKKKKGESTKVKIEKVETVSIAPQELAQPVVGVPWFEQPPVDEWSGPRDNLVTSCAVEPSSDWSAPSEEWGNYEEPAKETPPPQEKEQLPEPAKEFEEPEVEPEVEVEVEAVPEAPVKKQPTQDPVPIAQPVKASPPAAVEEKVERPAVREDVSQKATVTQVPQKPIESEHSAQQINLSAPVQHKSPEESQVSKPAKKKKARRET
ncbi:protein LYRIC-like [Aplochiton taeniatus]